MKFRWLAQFAMLALMAQGLSGCAASIVGGFTVSQLSIALGIVSSAVTGKGLDDQVLSLLTGRDCNLMEGLFNPKRKLCEPRGSLATKDDFKGFFVAYGGDTSEPLDRYARARQQELAEAQIASTPVAVNPAAAISFSLPIRIGVPKRGEPVGRARVRGRIVYTMAPIYDVADLEAHQPVVLRTPVPKYKPHGPHVMPAAKARVARGNAGS